MKALPQELAKLILNQEWRLNNLYHIESKSGETIRFKMNFAQLAIHREPHNRIDVLKARQLGVSTYTAVLMLDMCLFANGKAIRCAIVDKAQEDAYEKLAKIVFAYERLDYVREGASEKERALAVIGKWIKSCVTMKPIKGRIDFSNSCVISSGTSKRGGTIQFLHISELGYTAIHNPQKAREIISGSQNAVAKDGLIIRESTHEGGRYGLNYELLKKSMANQHNKSLSPIDFKFYFFSWWEHPDYILPNHSPVQDAETAPYFEKLERTHGIKLSDERKAWYTSMNASQPLGLMKQEYPSTPDEAFDTTIKGALYGDELARAEAQGRIGRIIWEDCYNPLYVAVDIGYSDLMTMWLMQPREDGMYYILNYYAANRQTLDHYVEHIRGWEQQYGKRVQLTILPHDASKKGVTSHHSVAEEWERFGLPTAVLPRISDVFTGIRYTRRYIDKCIFSVDCEASDVTMKIPSGVNCLRFYRTAPEGADGAMQERPKHDINSHGADSFRYIWEAVESGLVGRAGNVPSTQTYNPPVAARGITWH